MGRPRVNVRLAIAIVTVALGSRAALADFSDDERKCSNKVHSDARKVLDQEQKGNQRNCIKGQFGDSDLCVDLEQAKAADKRIKLLADHAAKCAALPPFGVNGDADAIANAVEEAADNVARAILGEPVDGLDASPCQHRVVQRAGQLAVAEWKAFRKCAKDLAAITSLADLEGCVQSGIASGEASKGAKLVDAVTTECPTIPPPGTDDSTCGSETTAAGFAACVGRITACQVCVAINATIEGTADCDVIDDGASNSSCLAVCAVSSGIPSPVEDTLEYETALLVGRLANESPTESLANLSSVSGFYEPGYMSESIVPADFDEIRTVLSNRRVAKVLADLRALPARDQAAVLRTQLDNAARVHQQLLAAALIDVSAQASDERFLRLQISDDPDGPTLRGATLAWEALCVLAGVLSQDALLAEHLEPQAVRRLQMRSAAAEPIGGLELASLGRPIVAANALYLASASGAVGRSNPAARAGIIRTVGNRAETIKLLPFDATVWPTDLLHTTFARPVDESRVLDVIEVLALDDASQERAVYESFFDSATVIPRLEARAVNNPTAIANGGPIYYRMGGVNMMADGYTADLWVPADTGWDGHNTGAGNRFEHAHVTNNYPIGGITAAMVKDYWDDRYAGFSASDGTVDVAQNCHGYSTTLGTWVQSAGMAQIIADDYALKAPQCPEATNIDWFTAVDHSERITFNCPGCDCATRAACCFVGQRVLKNRDSPVYTFQYFCPGGGGYMTLYKHN